MAIDIARLSQSWPLSTQSLTIRRTLLASVVILAAMTGVIAGHLSAPDTTADADLTLLLRFMALMKAAIVLAAAGLVAWRFGSELPSRLAAGYIAAVGLMALSPGLIWSQSSLTLASAFFHSGLLFGLALAARDGFTKSRNEPQANSASTHLRMP
jgi:hypothetical protein